MKCLQIGNALSSSLKVSVFVSHINQNMEYVNPHENPFNGSRVPLCKQKWRRK
jgi:hypothetical protein